MAGLRNPSKTVKLSQLGLQLVDTILQLLVDGSREELNVQLKAPSGLLHFLFFRFSYPVLSFIASSKLFNAFLLEEEVGTAGVQVSELRRNQIR